MKCIRKFIQSTKRPRITLKDKSTPGGFFSAQLCPEKPSNMTVAVGDVNRILLVFSVTLLIYANPALSQLGECLKLISVECFVESESKSSVINDSRRTHV